MLHEIIEQVVGSRVRVEVCRAASEWLVEHGFGDEAPISPASMSHWTAGRDKPSHARLRAVLAVCEATGEQQVAAWRAFGVPDGVLADPHAIEARRRDGDDVAEARRRAAAEVAVGP